ncbi:integrase [Tamlana nanhaiensis]|uniref:Integrase n=1 Tax=Neotamlana nanhaiensis TaxID=1382798 RepID=A0A0D7VXE3_9FLAO|nr:site-specific integrase [Tamlana nanhaiensis]KJD31118.1 integrase [Tamlana nanhaiensis]
MKTQTTFGVTFFTRLNSKKTDNALIFVRITVNGKRSELSLKRNVSQKLWDKNKGKVKGNSQEARALNNYIQQVRNRLYDSYSELQKEGRLITVATVKSRYLGTDEQHKTLLQLVSYHNKTMQTVLKLGTLKNYKTTERYLKKFVKKVYKVDDIQLKQLNYGFVIHYEQYLHKLKNLNNNDLMKHIERFKKLCKFGLKLEWLEKDPAINFQLHFDEVERDYLTEEELNILETAILERQSHKVARDIFVFSCYTGLAYCDVYALAQEHIVLGIDGNQWISTQREKTATKVRVPLLDKALTIIKKYKSCPKCIQSGKLLPVYSNQKMNQYIKKVAKKLKIKKNLSFLIARHTFATTVTLSNGVPIETVSKLLGHTKISTTQIYARVIKQKVSDDMLMLKQKINNRDNFKMQKSN